MASVATALIPPQPETIKAHLLALFAPLQESYPKGLVELRYGQGGKLDRSAYFGMHDTGLSEAAEFAANRNHESCNVYVGVNPRKPGTDRSKAASATDVECAIWHFADIDKAPAVEQLGRRIRSLPPTMSVTTGTVPNRRPHLYWQLEEPSGNMADWTQRQRNITAAVEGDAVIDPPRIMRLAGTVNYPTQDKIKKGYKPELVTLKTEFDEERPPVIPQELDVAFPAQKGVTSNDTLIDGQTTLQAMRRTQTGDLIEACRSGHEWHNNMVRLTAHMAGKGRSTAEILAIADHITLPGYTVDQTVEEMAKALHGAREKYGFAEPEEEGVESEEAEREEVEAFKATPFVWRDEAAIPPRKWLYGRHLLRRFLSVDIAAGGVGKSSVKIGEALAMAANRPIYGKDVCEGPLGVWIYNLEDPNEETERRIHAAAKRFGFTPEDFGNRLFVDSGREQPCVIAEETKDGVKISRPIVNAIISEIKTRNVDVLIVDPFVSSHAVTENDNKAIDVVAKEWARIADECNCSINLVHHIRKQNGSEATAESARGAISLIAAARSVIVYNRMTKEEAESAGITPEEASFIFRAANDKANLSPPERADWYRMNNTDLDNGDKVGVACSWQWPDPFDGVSLAHLRQAQRAISEGQWRASNQSPQWVGYAVAPILNIEPSKPHEKKRLGKIIAEWIKTGMLEVVEQQDDKRKLREFVVVGRWVDVD